MTRYAALRLLCWLWPPRTALEAPMPPRAPIVDRWLALPHGPHGSRLLGERRIALGDVMRYAYLADQETRDDGAVDLGGIAGLFWNLIAS